MRRTYRATAGAASALFGAALLAGCATAPSTSAGSAEDAAQRLTTTTTVIDDGSGVEFCPGVVLESYPPQCAGTAIAGWSWAGRDDDFEESGGVRWGRFSLVGTYDGASGVLTLESATAVQDPATQDADSVPASLCAGGGDTTAAQDERTAQDEALAAGDPDALQRAAAEETALEEARGIEGYAAAWITADTLNFLGTGDLDEALARLQRSWGGEVCTASGPYSAAELEEVSDAVPGIAPDAVSSAVDPLSGTVEVTVVHDDGTMQDAFDAQYGAGVVQVISALVPVSG